MGNLQSLSHLPRRTLRTIQDRDRLRFRPVSSHRSWKKLVTLTPIEQLPLQRIIGDVSNTQKDLLELDLLRSPVDSSSAPPWKQENPPQGRFCKKFSRMDYLTSSVLTTSSYCVLLASETAGRRRILVSLLPCAWAKFLQGWNAGFPSRERWQSLWPYLQL